MIPVVVENVRAPKKRREDLIPAILSVFFFFFFFLQEPRLVMYCEHRARLGTEDVIILYSITRAILPNAHASALARMHRGALLP